MVLIPFRSTGSGAPSIPPSAKVRVATDFVPHWAGRGCGVGTAVFCDLRLGRVTHAHPGPLLHCWCIDLPGAVTVGIMVNPVQFSMAG